MSHLNTDTSQAPRQDQLFDVIETRWAELTGTQSKVVAYLYCQISRGGGEFAGPIQKIANACSVSWRTALHSVQALAAKNLIEVVSKGKERTRVRIPFSPAVESIDPPDIKSVAVTTVPPQQEIEVPRDPLPDLIRSVTTQNISSQELSLLQEELPKAGEDPETLVDCLKFFISRGITYAPSVLGAGVEWQVRNESGEFQRLRKANRAALVPHQG